ncbi:MAG: spermidine/putrescine ABC transporter substrate-binding protein [unclassified Hahellaceae]|nr:spermidine/putrescine ABC transporter substrate-binding protein [Hahellaceae bacterium]
MKLRRPLIVRTPLATIMVSGMLALVSMLANSADTLRILTWEDFIAPALIEAWTRETGSAVKLAYFDSDEERDSIIAEGKAKFDLVVVDGLSSLAFGKRDLFAEITVEHAPNLRHIDPRFTPDCRAGTGVPYLWGTVGLVYRSDKLAKPDSWSALMTPEKSLKGHIGMIDDYADTFIPPLVLLGEDINADEPEVLRKAFEMLKAQLPYVLTYDYPVTFLQTEEGEKLYLAMGYNGDQHILNDYSKAGTWAYTVPKEGTATWVDCMAIPQNSESPALARRFIDFINEPANAAMNAEALGIATGNLAAKALISPELVEDPSVYPPVDFSGSSGLQGYRSIGRDNLNLRNRITRALVKLHEAQ